MRPGTVLLAVLVAACGASNPPQRPPGSTGPPPGPDATDAPPPVTTDQPPPDPRDDPGTSRCAGPPPAPDFVCVQDCGPPVVRAGEPPPGYRWRSPDDRFRERCPRCLPTHSRIATPRGEIDVASLREGDPIWTLDREGRRIPGRILLVGSTPIARHHELVQITLVDGRRVAASGQHPTLGGLPIGRLVVGDALDGSIVRRVAVLPYEGSHTYDVLPSGPTQAYWADGVLLESTLQPR